MHPAAESGAVYCLGLNHYGQCGAGHDTVRVWEPAKVQGLDGEHIVAVALGFQHGLALTKQGKVGLAD
jgi:alpha-tubulin suppressor-like RCC1 family protein